MNSERRKQVESLCVEALSKDGADRSAFLDAACAGESELRAEVESLLAGLAAAPLFLETPAWEVEAPGLPSGTRLGPYEIETRIGAGGMGEVYKAHDTRLDRTVAIKVLPPQLADHAHRARLEREARAIATLSHPHICTLYDVGNHDGSLFLVMEYLEGQTLAERLRKGALPLDEALEHGAHIAASLAAAHRQGIVHRDLKPGNVMLTQSGAKLLDFGLAKLVQPPGGSLAMTAAAARSDGSAHGQLLGTVAYMSPEQARGEDVDSRSDLFSFGAVLYEMLTGRRPFQESDVVSTLAAILHSEPVPPSELVPEPLPPELERIVLRCLRKNRERRFQSASDLELELDDLREGTRQHRAGVPSSPRVEHPRRSSSLWLAVLAVGALAAGLAYFAFRRPATPAEPSPGLRQLTFEAGVAITPAISPDGRLLAYASDRSGEGQLDIWLKQVAGGEPTRITYGPDSKVSPQFSADGTRIYYLGAHGDIVEVPTLGGESRRVLQSAGPFSVSNSDEIVFHRPGTGTTPGPMFVLSATGSSVEPWHPECVSRGAPVWSPDGLRIAFFGDCRPLDPSLPATVGIHVAQRTGGTVQRIGMAAAGVTPRLAWARLPDGSDGLFVPRRSGDSVNLSRLALDGRQSMVTHGTGQEIWPTPTPSGNLVFARLELTPSVWSLPLTKSEKAPLKEAAPARMFGTSLDGAKLVFGRMVGFDRGQLVLRDRAKGTEIVLATHTVPAQGSGSLWPQVSPDGSRVVYRMYQGEGVAQFVVATDGGPTRRLELSRGFNVASDWSRDGHRVIGECDEVKGGLCELLPGEDRVRVIGTDPAALLLFPSLSWDGRWMTFMRRRPNLTTVVVARVSPDLELEPPDRWLVVSPSDADATRPRFSPDGSMLFYYLGWGNVTILVRQRLDPATKHPIGAPEMIAPILNIPPSALHIGLQYVITVTRDRVFFNTAEVRSNVWMTTLR